MFCLTVCAIVTVHVAAMGDICIGWGKGLGRKSVRSLEECLASRMLGYLYFLWSCSEFISL